MKIPKLVALFTVATLMVWIFGYMNGVKDGVVSTKKSNFDMYLSGYKHGQEDFSEAKVRYSTCKEGINMEGLEISDLYED